MYDRNGVKIRSFPAVHIYDGPVDLRLQWNGLTFADSGNTTPSNFMIENGKGAGVLIHETFNPVSQLMRALGLPRAHGSHGGNHRSLLISPSTRPPEGSGQIRASAPTLLETSI